MPLLKRKVLQRVVESVNDNDEVFVCEITGELFRNYDDFFNRTMLLSSTVWSCAMTGRSNLTYRDALESERSAKRTLKTFPTALKGPILLIASSTKRTAIQDLASDVHGYAKDVFFKGETVYTKTGDPETIRKAKIVRVVISGSPNDHIPSRLIYHVESCDEGASANYSVRGEAIIRERNSLSREKCKLFLKQHVELGAFQMLCVKKESLEQFVTSKGCTDAKVFYGQKPDFKVSKKLQLQEKSSLAAQKTAKPPKIANQKRAKLIDKENNKKQHSIENYLTQLPNDSVAKKEEIIEKKKKRLEEHAKQKILAREQMQIEKERLLPQVAIALKEYSAIKEDLELTDHRVIPPAREVQTLIGEEYFPDFLFILEFLNTFGDLLSIETKFPDGVTMDLLQQALILREYDGPLSDILQVLLSTIFAALKVLETSEEANLESGTKNVANWCSKHFSTNLTDLPMDSTTVSEILRLHISAYSQSTYFGDACSILIRDHPSIMQTLATHSVFQLSTKSVMHIICALIHQLLMTDEVLSRVEKVGDARIKLKNNHQEQSRLTHKTKSLKQVAQDSMNKTLASYAGQMSDNELDECRKKLEQNLNDELAEIETNACRKMKVLQDEFETLNRSYNLYQVHLGSDRGFRNYWQFQSIPGLFVEHDKKFIGSCLERVTMHIPALAHCELKNRKKYITESILRCAGNSNGLLEKEGDIYEELLFRGINLLQQSNAPKKDALLLNEANPAVDNNVPATHPTNRELFMCTGNAENCPVHLPVQISNLHTKWGFYATRQELDALIKSLNPRGRREQSLRKALLLHRESIESRIERCPIEKLSIQTDDRTKMQASTFEPQHKNPEPVMPQSELLETMFRESLLELEGRITAGCLGELKVNSIEKWRKAILNRSYDSQINEKLVWGQSRQNQKSYVKKPNEESSSEESEEDLNDMFELCKTDQSYGLPETTNIDVSTQNQDASNGSLQNTVRSMASALLQIEQSIDIKFFRHPFGPKGICKDPNRILLFQFVGQKKLLRWEAGLMRATSFSQLFLHYHVLYDGIRWSRSIERAVCMVCRLKGNASVSLLCDECNRVCHMYCLKPKLKKIPEGDWFCMLCRPKDHESKYRVTGRMRTAEIIDYNESNTSDQDSENTDDSDDDGSKSIDEGSESGVVVKRRRTASSLTSSSEKEYESDKDEEDDISIKDPEETKLKIVIHKKAETKKENSWRSATRKANQGTGTVHAKRVHQIESKKAERTNKSTPRENLNRSNAGRRSLDAKKKKVNTSHTSSRTARNPEIRTVKNQSLQRRAHPKRARETESKKDEHAKKSKLSENINSPTTGRRSLRLSTKES
ncbi:bromodomain adjacent to zinc finger domain protein 1A-like [Anopheles marshallii]|uniref:bromodomain adjacent to zinc finger domain protein 1A-like n=1 Tax=Anopheles marshallii TaxID=1521116 RepID=UPI00237A0FA0|nr:bromodomain adjacent to zinc finger domain protein 1A-like [Anopheles marshallii]